jgi:hypothetical protein
MVPTQQSPNPAALDDVVRLFNKWRAVRKPKSRIPNQLWEAAASLSEQYSVNHIAGTLRLNHTALKGRIAEQNFESEFTPSPQANFLEIPALQPTVPSQCLIEMENRQGEKMRMHFTGEVSLELFALSKSFWECRS